MKRVGWDLDGVHYHYFSRSVWETMKQLKIVDAKLPMPVVTDWHFYREPSWGGMTDSEFVEICHKGADLGLIFTYGGFDEDSIAVMNKLYMAGHPTVIITDRSFGSTPQVSHTATLRLLKEYKAMYDEIWFTAEKTTIDIDYMIDDRVENFVSLSDAGVKCFLLDQPWNRHIDAGEFRLTSVDQYADIIIAENTLTAGAY